MVMCAADSTLEGAPSTPMSHIQNIPSSPAVYALYDAAGLCLYIGLSRKVGISVSNHLEDVPEIVAKGFVKVGLVSGRRREDLQGAWKAWMQEYVTQANALPPGNEQGVTTFTKRKVQPAKPMLALTPGKGAEDLTVPMTELLAKCVKDFKVVAFIKGTRTQPECGFSHQVLTILTENKIDFEAVNVMDEEANPGVRDAIKDFSMWPTIPQVYIGGEMAGGAEILQQMVDSGELKAEAS